MVSMLTCYAARLLLPHGIFVNNTLSPEDGFVNGNVVRSLGGYTVKTFSGEIFFFFFLEISLRNLPNVI